MCFDMAAYRLIKCHFWLFCVLQQLQQQQVFFDYVSIAPSPRFFRMTHNTHNNRLTANDWFMFLRYSAFNSLTWNIVTGQTVAGLYKVNYWEEEPKIRRLHLVSPKQSLLSLLTLLKSRTNMSQTSLLKYYMRTVLSKLFAFIYWWIWHDWHHFCSDLI